MHETLTVGKLKTCMYKDINKKKTIYVTKTHDQDTKPSYSP